jgi:hypothetical protein
MLERLLPTNQVVLIAATVHCCGECAGRRSSSLLEEQAESIRECHAFAGHGVDLPILLHICPV